MDKKRNSLILGSFIAFFVILLVERVFVLLYTMNSIGFAKMFGGAKFDLWTNLIIVFGIGVFLILFLFALGKILSMGVDRSYKVLIISAGFMLIASKVNNGRIEGVLGIVLAVVEYLAYACLLAGYFFRYLDIRQDTCLNKGYTISSFVYISLFLLAIPVIQKTAAGNKNMGFYYAEALGMMALVVVFVIMSLMLFSDKYKSVNNIFFIIALFLIVLVMTLLVIGQEDFKIVILPLIFTAGTIAAFVVNRIKAKKVQNIQ